MKKDMTAADMVKIGREIMEGKGLCLTCHTIGKTGGPFRFPDLAGVDVRAGNRVPGLTDVEYLAQSIYEPSAFIVPGFNPGMPVINKPPIGLSDQEILCVIAYLQCWAASRPSRWQQGVAAQGRRGQRRTGGRPQHGAEPRAGSGPAGGPGSGVKK